MRERALATAAIWISSIFITYALLNSLIYIVPEQVVQTVQAMRPDGELVPQEIMTTLMQPTLMPEIWQYTVAGMLFMLFIVAAFATVGVWRHAFRDATETRAAQRSAVRQSAKVKREQRERVKRLLEDMDEDEIAYLEQARYQHLSDDGELVTRH
jgi:hypothetical protein